MPPVAKTSAQQIDHPMLYMRPHWRYTGRVPNLAWGGQQQQIQLLQFGYCPGVLLRVFGQYDIAVGGSTLRARAPYTVLQRVQVQPPGGQTPWNITGWNTKMFNLVHRDFAPFMTGADSGTVTPTYVNGVTRSAVSDESFPNVANTPNQTFQVWYFIPFHRSSYDLRGMLPVQKLLTTLWLYPATLAQVFTTPANLANATLNVDVFQMVYDPPPARPGIGPVDTGWLIAATEYVNPNGAPIVGDNNVRITDKGVILDVLHTIALNDALDSADINTLMMKVDDTYITDRIDARAWWWYQRGFDGRDLPRGVVHYNFDRLVDADGAAGVYNPHFMLSMGEWLVSDDDVAAINSTINLSGGIAGATNDFWTAIRRLIRFA